MLLLSWSTFRERWQLFVGAIVTVCLGVALVQSSLLTLVAATTAQVPPGMPEAEARALRVGYDDAASLLGMIVGLSAFLAIFIVASTFAFTVAQRRRDLALFRLAGAGRRQVRTLLLGEALLLGATGTASGVVLGIPLMRFEAWLLEALDFVPAGFVGQWRPWVVAVSAGTGVGVALLGVLGASRRASRVRPIEALRETGPAARVMTWSRWLLGLVFLAGGVALLGLAPAVGGEGALAMSIFVSIVLVLAFTSLAPLVVPLVGRLVGLVTRGSALGHLAQANLRDGVRRTASTAAPVMVLAAFVAGIGGTLATIAEAARQETARTLVADYVVTADRPIRTELAAVPGIGAVSEEVPVALDLKLWDDYDPVDALAVDPATYLRTHRLNPGAGDVRDLHGASVAVSPSYAPELRLRVGDTLPARIGGVPKELRIVALLPSTVAGPYFLVPSDLVPVPPGTPHRYLVAGGVDPAALAAFGPVEARDAWIRHSDEEQQRTNVKVMVALLGLATLYTAIAIVNAVVISAADRRDEFAGVRAIGFTRGQVVRMALREALAVVGIGLFLGGLAAAGTLAGVAAAIRDILGYPVVSVPWPLLAGLALGVAATVSVTSVLTTMSATRPALSPSGLP